MEVDKINASTKRPFLFKFSHNCVLLQWQDFSIFFFYAVEARYFYGHLAVECTVKYWPCQLVMPSKDFMVTCYQLRLSHHSSYFFLLVIYIKKFKISHCPTQGIKSLNDEGHFFPFFNKAHVKFTHKNRRITARDEMKNVFKIKVTHSSLLKFCYFLKSVGCDCFELHISQIWITDRSKNSNKTLQHN